MKLLIILLSSLFVQANEQYAAGNYADAADKYAQVIAQQPSAVAYYNLGNAYFKMDTLAQAILAYERCLRLDPRNDDARHNLEFAQSRIVDNIEPSQTFFLAAFLTKVRDQLMQSTWTVLCLSLFLLCLVAALFFIFAEQSVVRKTCFSVAIVALLFSLFSFFAARSLYNRDQLREEAIITQGVVHTKSAPNKNSTDLLQLHEGTKVRIIETSDDGVWCNIEVGNSQGWILLKHLERI